MVATHVLRSYDASGRQRPDLRVSDPVKSLAYDAPLGLVAATKGDLNRGGSTQGKLVVGRAAHGHVHLTSVPGGRRYYQALAWVDPTHVTTMRLTRTGLVYDVVDVTTGDRHQLTRKPWYAFQVASDALRDPAVVPGVAPPQPWNPRWIAGGVIGVVLVAGVGGLALRRSRARG
jgi:hypothetical protein